MTKYPIAITFLLTIALPGTLLANFHAYCDYDTTRVKVEAMNLSEDMSNMSSRNDEIIVLVYDFTDTTKLAKPLAAEFFVLDSLHRSREFSVAGANNKSTLLFFLVEQDTEKPVSQIEITFRKHFKEIIKLVEQRNRMALEKLTGTDDLMGYKIIEEFNAGPVKYRFHLSDVLSLTSFIIKF